MQIKRVKDFKQRRSAKRTYHEEINNEKKKLHGRSKSLGKKNDYKNPKLKGRRRKSEKKRGYDVRTREKGSVVREVRKP